MPRRCLAEDNSFQLWKQAGVYQYNNGPCQRPAGSDVALLCPENQLRSSMKWEGWRANRPRLISPRSIAATGAQGGRGCNGFVRGPTQAGESPGTAPGALHLLQLLARLKHLISRHAPTITRQVGKRRCTCLSSYLPTFNISLQHNQFNRRKHNCAHLEFVPIGLKTNELRALLHEPKPYLLDSVPFLLSTFASTSKPTPTWE